MMADQRPGLDMGALANWPVAMLNEVAALPGTLKSARQLIADLARLAEHLSDVGDQIERQMQSLIGPMTNTVFFCPDGIFEWTLTNLSPTSPTVPPAR